MSKKSTTLTPRVRHRARPRTGFLGARTQNSPEETSTGSSNGPVETHADRKVEWRAIGELQPYRRNARKHSSKQIAQISASIRRFGFINPILIDNADQIMAGHGRVEAAKETGLDRVPTLRVDHLSEAEKRAYIIADNRLAELAGWDNEILAIELQNLSDLDLDFDLEITGFETAEIDLIIDGPGSDPAPDAADEIPETGIRDTAVSRTGDLWQLGRHLLYCGDGLKAESYQQVLGDEKARMVFTDPPYNVPIAGHVSGLGRTQHREFAMASGEMSETEFTAFLETILIRLTEHTHDGAVLDICMDWRHLHELLVASRQAGLRQLNLCVWNKDNGGMGSLYRSKHELICVFKSGDAPHINNVELGRYGRYRTNVWDYAGVNSFKAGRDAELAMHPTVKPVALVADAIKDCTRRNDIVLDPFSGSGTTIVAAERSGRVARAIELDPCYVDVSIRRWERVTGQSVVHVESGRTFDQMSGDRNADSHGEDLGKEASHG